MTNSLLEQALWRIYGRVERPEAWGLNAGNLPWHDPQFSERMLREHLDQTHGAASRTEPERALQIAWLWQKLGLQAGHNLFDVTCGPGLYAVDLAKKGCHIFGVDFSPASIAYAQDWVKENGVEAQCKFVEKDVRVLTVEDWGSAAYFDGAILLGKA